MLNIVLHQPEIPHNTGAIGRTCLMTNSALHLIHPLGFFLDEKSLKRSGLDYWHKISVHEYMNFQDFMKREKFNRSENPTSWKCNEPVLYFAESGNGQFYTDVKYKPGDYIMFGSETTGIPQKILDMYPERTIKIPMTGEERSLNLSVSVGVVLYEALRQNNFIGLI